MGSQDKSFAAVAATPSRRHVLRAGAAGIAVLGAGATIEGNVVSTITGTPSTGILAGTGSFVRQNTVSNAGTGVSGGKYQDNLIANCTTAYTGGIDAGGNN